MIIDRNTKQEVQEKVLVTTSLMEQIQSIVGNKTPIKIDNDYIEIDKELSVEEKNQIIALL